MRCASCVERGHDVAEKTLVSRWLHCIMGDAVIDVTEGSVRI